MSEQDLKYFIGADVHKSTTTLTILDQQQNVIDSVCLPTRVPILRAYLEAQGGPKGLAMEEMGLAQWLYTTLKPFVNELIVCDPYRNHLLKEGAKTDPIDSLKLARLYQCGFLKPVFHSDHKFMDLRNWVRVYNQTTQALVRAKNEVSAYVSRNSIAAKSPGFTDSLDFKVQRERVVFLERQKRELAAALGHMGRHIPEIGFLKSVDGIGPIGAVKILAAVVDGNRFRSKHAFWSYCGLVKHPRQSGNQIYGYSNTRYNRELKSVFKTAAVTILKTNGALKKYYDEQREKPLNDKVARHALARKVAAIALSCLKNKRNYQPEKLH